jgi:hypothetical protein
MNDEQIKKAREYAAQVLMGQLHLKPFATARLEGELVEYQRHYTAIPVTIIRGYLHEELMFATCEYTEGLYSSDAYFAVTSGSLVKLIEREKDGGKRTLVSYEEHPA